MLAPTVSGTPSSGIETLATVGYGEMCPAALYGHAIGAIEIAGALGFTAIVTS